MLTFKKYNSIENTFDEKFLEKIRIEGFDNQTFVIQEKVHGSNICFVTDGRVVNTGKRTGFIGAEEKFYNYEELAETYKPKVLSLFSAVKQKYPETLSVTVFGEMFGGKYPHPDVKNDSRIMVIQKGVFYCPYHEFYAFDLYINTSETGFYLTTDEVNNFLENGKFIYAKTVFRGTFDECLKFPNDFQTKIPEWLGLPSIKDNICEGIVIRPVEPVYLRNGARLLLKSKNERFAEKKAMKKRDVKLFDEPAYSENLKRLLPVAEDYVTGNRLNSLVSKIGPVSVPKDTGKLIGLFSKDILDDFLKEHSGEYALLEKNEQKIFNRHINSQATSLIKKVYLHIDNSGER